MHGVRFAKIGIVTNVDIVLLLMCVIKKEEHLGCQYIFYNPIFQFGTILQGPSNTFPILELFNDATGKEIYTNTEDSDYFPSKIFTCLIQSGIFHFLPTYTRQVFLLRSTLSCQP